MEHLQFNGNDYVCGLDLLHQHILKLKVSDIAFIASTMQAYSEGRHLTQKQIRKFKEYKVLLYVEIVS